MGNLALGNMDGEVLEKYTISELLKPLQGPLIRDGINGVIGTHYVQPLEDLSSKPKSSYLASVFIDGITQKVLQTIFSKIFPKSGTRFFEADAVELQKFAKPFFHKLLGQGASEKRLHKIIFSDGRSLERRADGAIVTNMFGFNMVNTGKFNCNGVLLDGKWSDEELIASLSQQLDIAQVLYA